MSLPLDPLPTADPRDQQIEDLQERLAGEKDARIEDRFFFVFIALILLNVVFFSVLDNLGGPVALLLLELAFLALLAKRMGMEEVYTLFDRFAGRIASTVTTREE